MTHSIILRPAAEADLDEAYVWYEKKQTGLGTRLLDHVKDALEKLKRWPDLGIPAGRGLRRAAVASFPYGVFYVVHGDQIVVVGVFHGRRAPRRWKARLKD